MADQAGKVHFLGREHESHRVEEAFRNGESMMISGPADIGKTALIRHVLRGLPKDVGSQYLYLAGFKNLQDLLRKLLTSLYQARNVVLRHQLRAEGISGRNFEAWLKKVSSPRMKGALYRAIEHSDYRVILDHVPPQTRSTAKVIKELFWMRHTPVYLLVRDEYEHRVDQLSHFFYWGRRERLALRPLPKPVARELLEQCIWRFRLSAFDLDDFREVVLDLSGCVPGAIVKMCALAGNKRYQYGRRIKTKLVHIDYLMSGSSLRSQVGRTACGRAKIKGT